MNYLHSAFKPVKIHYVLAAFILSVLAACNLSELQTSTTTPQPPTTSLRLTVAWVDAGNLVVWQPGSDPRRIASGGVIRPYVAPDGQHIVFTRGPLGTPETLWSVDTLGTAEQELVPREELRAFRGGQVLVNDVAWLDEAVLYFNTVRRTDTSTEAQDDLYRANIRTREVALILPGTEGGAFTISPDKAHIAVVYPGTYGRRDGVIRVVDPLGFESRNLLYFNGVSTGSEYKFYPRIFWEPDSTAMRVAIPDGDLIYDDVSAPPTTLWRLEVDGDRDSLGTAPASFFGLPQWSSSVENLTYLQRIGSGNSNDFELMVANDSGENPEVYANGQAGTLQPPQWIPGLDRFAYVQGSAGQTWMAGPGMNAVRLPNDAELMFQPLFVDESLYVFASAVAENFELRYGQIGVNSSVLIASVSNSVPVFDAVAAS